MSRGLVSIRDQSDIFRQWRTQLQRNTLAMSCLVNMSSDVMWYASQSVHAIYRGSRGIGLEKNLRCSLALEQNLQFQRVGNGSKICLARLRKHGGRKAAKENIFNTALPLCNKNFGKNKTGCASLKLNFTFLHVLKIWRAHWASFLRLSFTYRWAWF